MNNFLKYDASVNLFFYGFWLSHVESDINRDFSEQYTGERKQNVDQFSNDFPINVKRIDMNESVKSEFTDKFTIRLSDSDEEKNSLSDDNGHSVADLILEKSNVRLASFRNRKLYSEDDYRVFFMIEICQKTLGYGIKLLPNFDANVYNNSDKTDDLKCRQNHISSQAKFMFKNKKIKKQI